MRYLLISFGLWSGALFAQDKFPYSSTLWNMNGDKVNSEILSNNGNPILIDFWGAFCKPCIAKFIEYEKVYEQWKQDTGLKIIIVSIDDVRMQGLSRKLIEKYQWSFESYFDPEGEFMAEFTDANSVPQTFLLDGQFNLIFSKSGASLKGGDADMARAMMEGDFELVQVDLSAYKKKIYSLVEGNKD